MTLTEVPGVRVGHWTDLEARTGVTVVVFPEPNTAAVEVRGAAPGTRETALLAPGMRIQAIQALVFSGGSAFGLATADGVVRELERDGRGHPSPAGVVPIVPAAILYDLGLGRGGLRPGPEEGAAAYRAAVGEAGAAPVTTGSVGAGTGATVGLWRGFHAARWSGVGTAAVQVGGATVGALAVVNAVGDVFTLEGEPLTGGPPVPDPVMAIPPPTEGRTTLLAVATDMALDRSDLGRLAVRSHDALGTCIRPGHTRYDGDAAFVVSCGPAPRDVDAAGEAAYIAVGRAIESAVRAADTTTPVFGNGE